MAIFFTSDLHLGHEVILKYRPRFQTVEEMDETILRNWNRKVTERDEVYFLGDLTFQSKHRADYYLQQMKGRKHLIVGNHDQEWMVQLEDVTKFFESIQDMKVLDLEDKCMTLCHFPMLEWYGSRYGKPSYLLHGHIHARTHLLSYHYIKEHLPNALNVGVDVNEYEPVTFEELLENNQRWYQRAD